MVNLEGKQHTCITCRVAFEKPEIQRDHYKTDWHRYNLKRKVAELSPITLSDFESKMKQHEQEMKVLSGKVKAPTGYCVCCRKSFTTAKAYENHLNSKKHKDTEIQFEKRENRLEIQNNRLNRTPSETQNEDQDDVDDDEDFEDVEEVDSDEWEEENLVGGESIPDHVCLFCPNEAKDLEKNLIHMGEVHSFFVPDVDYLVDLEGLMAYLGSKVGQGFLCLWCNTRSKQFQYLAAVQKHMRDKGHCKILNEGNALLEFAKFYDYSRSYPEDASGHGGATPMDQDGADQEVDLNALDDSGYELTLPSGAKIGHRSLMRYYKQSLNPDRQVAVRKPANGLLSHYKALGYTGLSASQAKVKANDIKFMNHIRQKHRMQLGVKANKLQKHWVDPTL